MRLVSWYPHRLDENVLWLHYEDLIENLRECVRLIAAFLNIGQDDDALQELVTHQVHPLLLNFQSELLLLGELRVHEIPF